MAGFLFCALKIFLGILPIKPTEKSMREIYHVLQ
jgi:hypothetical protein